MRVHIGDILSVTTGVLISPTKMDGWRDLMEAVVGKDLATIGLVEMREPVTEFLLKQHPQLSSVTIRPGKHAEEDLAYAVWLHGEYFDVEIPKQ